MTISLLTDGWICTPRIIADPSAPEGGEAIKAAPPGIPCAPGAEDPALIPPLPPQPIAAVGPAPPSIPCAVEAEDPTITAPATPSGTEADEDAGNESPATPDCTDAEET